MATITDSFTCPNCGSENGICFKDMKRGTQNSYCPDCGYTSFIQYKLTEEYEYIRIDDNKEWEYGNLLIEKEETHIPFAAYNIEMKNGVQHIGTLQSIEEYHEFVKNIKKKEDLDVKRVSISRFVDGKIEAETIYEL